MRIWRLNFMKSMASTVREFRGFSAGCCEWRERKKGSLFLHEEWIDLGNEVARLDLAINGYVYHMTLLANASFIDQRGGL